jgi:DDE family transposase
MKSPASAAVFAKPVRHYLQQDTASGVLTTLDGLLTDATAGDPVTGLKWTRQTLATISRELKQRGYHVWPGSVCRLLRKMGDRLRANRKRLNKKHDPARPRRGPNDRRACRPRCRPCLRKPFRRWSTTGLWG